MSRKDRLSYICGELNKNKEQYFSRKETRLKNNRIWKNKKHLPASYGLFLVLL